MKSALIGCSGFVGTTLLKQVQQVQFDELFWSANIADIQGKAFDLVVCAGAPGVKWLANKEPQADWENLEMLMKHIKSIQCRFFVLISTLDVFGHPVGVDENSVIDQNHLHAYGLHRHLLEVFVQKHFVNHLIIRLPGLVGAGLRKNAIFDLLNDNCLDMIDHRAVFQFYPMVHLWRDIEKARKAGLTLVHLTAEPVSIGEVAKEAFDMDFANVLSNSPPHYDFQTIHAKAFGSEGRYQYKRADSLDAIRDYARTEARTLK